MGAPELFVPLQKERESTRTWETHFLNKGKELVACVSLMERTGEDSP